MKAPRNIARAALVFLVIVLVTLMLWVGFLAEQEARNLERWERQKFRDIVQHLQDETATLRGQLLWEQSRAIMAENDLAKLRAEQEVRGE